MDSDAIELRNLKTSHIGSRGKQNVEEALCLSSIRNRSFSGAIGRHKDTPQETTSLSSQDEMISNQDLVGLQDVSQGQEEVRHHGLSWKEVIFGITLENNNSIARDHVSF